MRAQSINPRDQPQRHGDQEEPQELIQKGAPGPNDGAIGKRLVFCVVTRGRGRSEGGDRGGATGAALQLGREGGDEVVCFVAVFRVVVVGTFAQHGEALVEVPRDEGEEGDYGEDYIGDEGVCERGEGGCETVGSQTEEFRSR